MIDRRPDRRVRRTKRRLKDALLELIEERDYDRITIQDITDRADVGRSTFYSHFTSKEDLLFSGFDDWLLSLTQTPAAEAGSGRAGEAGAMRFRFSLPLLHHMQSQRRFFQATMARGSDVRIRRKITDLLVEMVRRDLDRISPDGAECKPGRGAAGPDAETLRQARAHGVVGAFLGLASWWLSDADELGAEAVDRLFQGLFDQPAGSGPPLRSRP